jgi:redox-sensitive bicupin YhaK (pirin superfamily)
MKTIKDIHKASFLPIADLATYSPLPSGTLRQIDPFLFLNHHGPQKYSPYNRGLPFGPHPHRGMETVTIIIDGDIMHKDSGGHESIIEAGGVQWMTAGKGLIHSEVSSKAFKEKGGNLEILQLWINLPAKYKMVEPNYIGLQKEDIPVIALDEGKVEINLISGTWGVKSGAFNSMVDVSLQTINFKPGGEIKIEVPVDQNVFFYIIKGNFSVNNLTVSNYHLVEFINDAEEIHIIAREEGILLLGHAHPINETIVAQRPFVMNTEEEIHQAYEDYRLGKFGKWK